jgi:DNA-binding CsgD family transcriptional regulator
LTVDANPKSRATKRVVSAPDNEAALDSSAPDEISAAQTLPLPSLNGGSTVRDLLSAGLEALDLLNIGLMVCSASAELLIVNQTANQILKARDGLELDSDGMLSTICEETESLKDLVKRVAETSRGQERGSRDTAFAVQRATGKRPLTLFVRAVKTKTNTPAPNEAAVLIMILDSAQPVEATEAELRQLYGFTATEARLANHLMEGSALEDCCEAMGIRRTTARMHLRNIFAKAGVRRQGELVSLLLKSIGLGPRLK